MELTWNSKYVRVLTVVLLVQAVLFYTASHGDSRPLMKPLKDFPQTLPGWQMVSQSALNKDVLDALRADDTLTRVYLKTPLPDLSRLTPTQRDSVMATAEQFYVAYFSTQQQGQTPHSPKYCLPANGWQPAETSKVYIPIPGSAPINVNKYLIEKEADQMLALYWFQSHGRVVASEFAEKIYLVADSLRYHRSDTALVRIMVPIVHNDLDAAMDGATKFVQVVYPAIYHYLPM